MRAHGSGCSNGSRQTPAGWISSLPQIGTPYSIHLTFFDLSLLRLNRATLDPFVTVEKARPLTLLTQS